MTLVNSNGHIINDMKAECEGKIFVQTEKLLGYAKSKIDNLYFFRGYMQGWILKLN